MYTSKPLHMQQFRDRVGLGWGVCYPLLLCFLEVYVYAIPKSVLKLTIFTSLSMVGVSTRG